jgi:LPS export ABC transporter protein LptC
VKEQLIGLVVLVTLAAGSWWLAGGREAATPAALTLAAAPSGYYLKDAELTQTGGGANLSLRTERIEEDPRTGESSLGPLSARYAPAGGGPWHVVADRGRLSRDGSALALEGHVTLEAEGGARPLAGARLTTSELSFDSAASEARTEAPVSIEIGARAVTAVGLRADMKQERLWLKSSVHGQFTP